MKKTASALVLAGSLAFFGAGAANASEGGYPPVECVGVSSGTVTPGSQVVFSSNPLSAVQCFGEDSTIQIDVDYSNEPTVTPGTGVNSVIVLAEPVAAFTTTTDGQGGWSIPITLGEAGTYTLTATGMESRTVASAVVTVIADNSDADNNTNDGDLADTGADSAMLLWGAAGIVAVGAGVASVAVARRKNA